MRLFLGIDGGGTRTRAFVCDAAAERAAWAEAGSTNPHHTPPAHVEQHLADAARAALDGLGATPADVASAFLGIAGLTDEPGREQMRRLAGASGLSGAQLGVDHDIRIALAGGLEGRPGVALIVGTGSSCYGRAADGRTWQTGGWEALVADEGSGYFLGREAIIAAVRMADGRSALTPLQAAVFASLSITDVSQIIRRLHEPPIAKTEVAALAPLVVRLADGGDAAARAILDRGAALLAELVAANHRRLPTGPGPEVVVTGGLGTADTSYRRRIAEAIAHELPGAQVNEPALSPAMGAALLALQQAGQPTPPGLLRRWKGKSP